MPFPATPTLCSTFLDNDTASNSLLPPVPVVVSAPTLLSDVLQNETPPLLPPPTPPQIYQHTASPVNNAATNFSMQLTISTYPILYTDQHHTHPDTHYLSLSQSDMRIADTARALFSDRWCVNNIFGAVYLWNNQRHNIQNRCFLVLFHK